MISSSALITTIILHSGYRSLLHRLSKELGVLLFHATIFFAFLFARIIGGIFYCIFCVLFIFPSWLHSFFNPPSSHIESQKQQKKKIDMPEGWVRVSICNTDEISELDLMATPGLFSLGKGTWERRDSFKVTREEIRRRVVPWLETNFSEKLEVEDCPLQSDPELEDRNEEEGDV